MTPFTIVNLMELEDSVAGRVEGVEGRFGRSPLDSDHLGVSLFRYAAATRVPGGHHHREQEEVYVVVGGSGRMKLDDEIVELAQWDAVRVSPGTWRGYEAGPSGLELIVIGAPHLGEAPRDDVQGTRDWWVG